MKENKKDIMLERLNQNKNNRLRFAPVIEESQAKEIEIPKTEIIEAKKIIKEEKKEFKTTSEQSKKKVERKKRNYYIPVDILESIDKVVYMDRDLKDNTDLVVKALRKYLDSKACRDLLEEYNNLKGNK